MAIDVIQSSTGQIEEADLTVEMLKTTTALASYKKWNKINYFDIPKDLILTGKDGIEVELPNDIDYANTFFATPIPSTVIGTIKIYNEVLSVQDALNTASGYGNTIIVGANASSLLVNQVLTNKTKAVVNNDKKNSAEVIITKENIEKAKKLCEEMKSVVKSKKDKLIEIAKTKFTNNEIFLNNEIKKIEKMSILPFNLPKDAIMIITCSDVSISDDFLTFANTPRQGVFIDTNNESHALLALTSMLSGREIPKYTNEISYGGLTATIRKVDADKLQKENISYFFNFKNGDNKLDWFGLGKEQGFLLYVDLIVKQKVKDAVANNIRKKPQLGYNDERITDIQGDILLSVKELKKYLATFICNMPTMEVQTLQDKKDGILKGIYVDYSIFGELRRVSITIEDNLTV